MPKKSFYYYYYYYYMRHGRSHGAECVGADIKYGHVAPGDTVGFGHSRITLHRRKRASGTAALLYTEENGPRAQPHYFTQKKTGLGHSRITLHRRKRASGTAALLYTEENGPRAQPHYFTQKKTGLGHSRITLHRRKRSSVRQILATYSTHFLTLFGGSFPFSSD